MIAPLFLAAALAASEPAPRISDSLVQIGILRRASLTVRPSGSFSVVDQKSGETHQLDDRKLYSIEARSSSLRFGPYRFGGQVRLLPKGAEDFVEVSGKKYGGSLILRPNSDATVTVVQETGIEDYLAGVLPMEMSPDWPKEALKAQAVVARTFTLSNLGKFQSSGFDLTDDSRSQAYAGLERMTPQTTAAVRETEGEVLAWDGQLLKVFFHSCCGGHTSNVATIWGSAEKTPAPARGVRDRYCQSAPNYAWSARFTDERVLDALRRHRLLPNKVKAVSLGKRDFVSGYVKTLLFKVDRGWLEVRANDFRNWIGNTELKSTKIARIQRRRGGWEFKGGGFGHGVGLCQWGTREQAQRGRGYRQILSYYFPGSRIQKRED